MRLAFLILFFTNTLQAEYRVYRLAILDDTGATQREVLSTLDHIQYGDYFHIPTTSSVRYLDSWKCYGHTGGFKGYCPNPKSEDAGRLPSSEENQVTDF